MSEMKSVDPPARVRIVDNPEAWSVWHISQNLTDRWGEINDSDAENKPLEALTSTPQRLEQLRSQMWGGICFVVRKDGNFGILFEVEYASRQSEASEVADAADLDRYLDHASLLSDLMDTVRGLQKKFPQIEFAIPHESNIFGNRLAIWGFAPDGALTNEQRSEIGATLLHPELW